MRFLVEVVTDCQKLEFSRLNSYKQETLTQLLGPVFHDLTRLESALVTLLETDSKTAQEIVQFFFTQKGKRIRPALFFYICNILGYDGPHKIMMGCVTEFVHTASLLHDDVIDNSTLRRNKPTVQTCWGDQMAILVGDLIYARASELMAKTGQETLITSFAQTIKKMSEGEIYQLEHVFDYSVSYERYLDIISSKTASLLATTCETAGILSDVSEGQVKALKSFGYNLGISFQLVDDALDYLGDEDVFGKKQYKDLEEGKVTLPLILLREKLSDLENSKIKKCFTQDKLLPSDIINIVKLIRIAKTAEITIEKAKVYTKKALEQLEQNFDSSYNMDPLKKMALELVQRIH